MAKKVLVAEDEPIVLSNLGDILRLGGAEPILAYDGKNALDLMLKAQEEGAELPSLVVTDLMMPNMGGTELIEAMRNNAVLKSIPVVVLSAKSDASDLKSAFSLGANDYLVKPFEIDELLAVVSRHLDINDKGSGQLV